MPNKPTSVRDVIKDELARADEYNRQAAEAPILDPWLESQRPNTPNTRDYLSQLNVNPVMATVKVPSADISLPIYHGTETSTLEKGVGHLFGTALPVGGEGTHTVLTGHSGLGSATMFDHLNASSSAMSSTSKSSGVTSSTRSPTSAPFSRTKRRA